MSANTIPAPRFKQNQTVEFIGGMGKIENYYSESGSWIYLVEMAMGPEPDFGRIGCETMILLPEPEMMSLAVPSEDFSRNYTCRIQKNVVNRGQTTSTARNSLSDWPCSYFF